ncbi:MAG: phosphatidate cytidylyltransferase [Firmicutes bacterium]|nr:phosphatidate cytidylyltransferase [Bacillota bacterium]
MKTRIISAICMAPVFIFVWLGGWPLLAFSAAVCFMGLFEFLRGLESMDVHVRRPIAYGCAAALFALLAAGGAGLSGGLGISGLVCFWAVLATLLNLADCLVEEDHGVSGAVYSLAALMYIALGSAHIYMTERLGGHNPFVWLIFLCAWGTDIFAYFTGYFLGKHKLCPKLSPKKTVEGAIGGVLGSVLCCCAFALAADPSGIGACAAIGLVGSAAAQCGDLIASAFKRKMGIKDYGRLIPGHGGIMDRFDSILLAAPFVYYCCVFFIYGATA